MKIEIQGRDAVQATKELLAIEGISGSYEIEDKIEKEGTVAIVVVTVTVIAGIVTIADNIHRWIEKYNSCQQNPNESRIDKVLIVTADGRRLILEGITVEQIKEILKG